MIGLEKGDFPYFLSKSLDLLNKNVLVIDNSKMKDLYGSLNAPGINNEDDDETVQQNGVTFVKNIAYSHRAFLLYDYVIVFHGLEVNYDYLDVSDQTYLVCNYEPKYIKALKQKFYDLKKMCTVHILLRDKINDKISDNTVVSSLTNGTDISVENVSVIPFDERDYGIYQSFTYNGVQKIKPLSADYLDVLAEITLKLTGVKQDIKYMKNIYKKA